MNEAIVDRLLSLRNADGGWGTTASRPSATEPTALASMAMRVAGRETDAAAASSWLLETQRQDGAWPVEPSLSQASWTTSLAVLALLDQPDSDEAARRGVDWLVAEKGIGIPLMTRIMEYIRGTRVIEIDPTLKGWPWAGGTFSWIEPTSYAVIALLRAWPGRMPGSARDRVDEARRMILDRACPGGGWNMGNKRILDVDMEPYPDTTALALLALSALGESAPQVDEGFSALDRLVEVTHSGLTLSLAILTRRAWRRETVELAGLLEATFERTAFLDEVRSLALATLALADAPGPLVMRAA
jgi:hypothetical protein